MFKSCNYTPTICSVGVKLLILKVVIIPLTVGSVGDKLMFTSCTQLYTSRVVPWVWVVLRLHTIIHLTAGSVDVKL